MSTIIFVAALVLALAVLIDVAAQYATPHIRAWLERRQVVRRSRWESQLKAEQAAQELAIHAWRARHQLYSLMQENQRPRTPSTPARRK